MREPLAFDVGNHPCAQEVVLDNALYGDEQNVSRLKDLAERLLDSDHHANRDSDKPWLFLGEPPTDLPAQITVPE